MNACICTSLSKITFDLINNHFSLSAGVIFYLKKIRGRPSAKQLDKDMHYVLLERFGDVLTEDK